MLISITTTHKPATDLGFLLVKHPQKTHHFKDVAFGNVVVTFSEANEDRCTADLILNLNNVDLVRGREGSGGGGAIDAYVNEKPFCANSNLAVALKRAYATALRGECKERPELASTPLPLEVVIASLPSRRGPQTIHELFGPLGYQVTCEQHPLDPMHSDWGPSDFHTVVLKGQVTVQALLTHLFILLPVLDADKHYFVGDAEVEKLIKHAGPWLNGHPLKDVIIRRYLNSNRNLTGKALDALAALQDEGEADNNELEGESQPRSQNAEVEVERQLSLHQQRHIAVHGVLRRYNVKSLVDMGCGAGLLLKTLMQDEQFEKLLGIEVSGRELEKGRYRLKLGKQAKPDRVRMVQGSVTYRDSLLRRQNFDAAVSVEVVEHIEPNKLDMFAMVMLGDVRPRVAIITTPNIEYNCRFNMQPGQLRHYDHRFEWTRQEFETWCRRQADRFGYTAVEFLPIGPVDLEVGAPSQMCVFERRDDCVVELPEMEDLPCVEEQLAGRRMDTRLLQGINIFREDARKAFEIVNRFGVDPRWMVYVPPTMSPCETAPVDLKYLEYPTQAFDHFARDGVTKVVCEKKHMGSRAVLVICKDVETARRRFGIDDSLAGCCYTRKGRRFFTEDELERSFITAVRDAITASGLWDDLKTDWVALDCELMPWSAKARDLIRRQYAALSAAGTASLPLAINALEKAATRGQDTLALAGMLRERLECVRRFRVAYNEYCWPVNGLQDYRLAPFHLLASEGAVHADKDHVWHMETLARIARASDGLVIATPYKVVDLSSVEQRADATRWWNEMTESGGEGMVVKPFSFLSRNGRFIVQPAVKVRGREYLRIIYGPDYTMDHLINRLRQRGLNAKRRRAVAEFALGMESLHRFVERQPLSRVHEAAFAVLALEAEACDPRL